jgi:RNA polymerase sigma-70 factor (ECF subfamily)
MNSSVDNSQPPFDKLIEQARAGCTTSLGTLLQQCRGYLLAIANQRLDEQLQAKMGGSDLVQQTLMYAHRDFAHFRGRSEAELLAWLQRILLNEVARANRDFLETAKRDVSREVAFGQQDGSRGRGSWLPADIETPSKQAAAEEDDARLEQALQRLNGPYRQVIELRNRDLHTFAEIGARMAISEERARRLWARAIERLRRDLAVDDEG